MTKSTAIYGIRRSTSFMPYPLITSDMVWSLRRIVTGMAAKMFVVAGPVIVFGTVASVVYGIIYWITTLF